MSRLLDNRPTDRYVPTLVTCANCGCSGDEFSWFQRIGAGDVANSEPATDLHFCDIVCLSQYVGDTYPTYEPTPGPVGVRYDAAE
ncbi:hypothetical protein [Halorarius halobius]|uniref:hypothetical protein n=1 Tax=Halorarius halobius TaxID=2962671 RepID=UPI0020CE7CFE|nr:hypothetical protein [Halorarius halobius]